MQVEDWLLFVLLHAVFVAAAAIVSTAILRYKNHHLQHTSVVNDWIGLVIGALQPPLRSQGQMLGMVVSDKANFLN